MGTHTFFVNETDTAPFPPTVAGAVNIVTYGAKGDGTTDDTAAVLLAVADAKANKKNVYFPAPAVSWILQPPSIGVHAVLIDFDNVAFFGDPGGSLITFRLQGGRSPDTAWDPVIRDVGTAAWLPSHVYVGNDKVVNGGHEYICLVGGTSASSGGPAGAAQTIVDGGVTWQPFDLVWRGSPFKVTSTAINFDPPRQSITFRDLIFDGGAPYPDARWPISAAAFVPITTVYQYTDGQGQTVFPGTGWDGTHRAVQLDSGTKYDNITVERCEIRNFRGESLAYFGVGCDRYTVRNTWIHDVASDGISMTAKLTLENVRISHCFQGIENDPYIKDNRYTGLLIEDCVNGMAFASSSPIYTQRGHTVVDAPVIKGCTGNGISVSGYSSNLTFRRGKIIDCGQVSGLYTIYITDQFGASPKNLDYDGLDIICDTATMPAVFNILMLAVPTVNMRIRGCRLIRTPNAIANGKTIGNSLGCNLSNAGVDWQVIDCDFRAASTEPQCSGAIPLFLRNRIDGLFAVTSPNLDPKGHESYELKPGGGVTLTTPINFQVGVETKLILNTNVTVQNNANIVLAGGVNFTPGANGAALWLERPTSASNRVVETRRAAY